MEQMQKFRDMGISERTLAQLVKKGFQEPTAIQEKAIPALLNSDRDIIGRARTGTGKTAAFGIPLVERLEKNSGCLQSLILVPTRELAIQVCEEIHSLCADGGIEIIPVYGGQPIGEQIRKLKSGVDIVVGTPGRVLDHIKRKSLHPGSVSYLVLDEADEMLNMGFIEDIEAILSHTGPDRRTLLFSATMPDRILKTVKKYMRGYVMIQAEDEDFEAAETDHLYYEVPAKDRFESLCRVIESEHEFYGLVFCRTKKDTDELSKMLAGRGYAAEGIHGDLSQPQRERILERFRARSVNVLAATDVAARGIDIAELTHVVNFSLPQEPETYIHRTGRTGRAGRKGTAISLIAPSEFGKLKFIMNATGVSVRKAKLPSVSDIIGVKEARIRSEIEEIMGLQSHHDYRTLAARMLKNGDPVDVVAALLRHSFDGELNPSSYREIGEVREKRKKERSDRGAVRLFVSKGIKDGLTEKKLLGIIRQQSGIGASGIGEVTVMDTHSFLMVSRADGERIMAAFKKKRGGMLPAIRRAR